MLHRKMDRSSTPSIRRNAETAIRATRVRHTELSFPPIRNRNYSSTSKLSDVTRAAHEKSVEGDTNCPCRACRGRWRDDMVRALSSGEAARLDCKRSARRLLLWLH